MPWVFPFVGLLLDNLGQYGLVGKQSIWIPILVGSIWFVVGQSGSIRCEAPLYFFPIVLIPCRLIRWHFSKCMPVGWLLLIANSQVSELETLGNQSSIYLWTPLFKVTDYLAANASSVMWRRALLLVNSEGTALQLLWGAYSPCFVWHYRQHSVLVECHEWSSRNCLWFANFYAVHALWNMLSESQ